MLKGPFFWRDEIFPMSASYEYQTQTNIFQKWCEQQLAQIEEMENEKDNNSYEAPHDLMLLQGKRAVLQHSFITTQFYREQPITQCLETVRKMVEHAIEKLNEDRSKQKEPGHFSLRHSRTLGEYSMLCDIERKLLSLE